MNNQQLLSVLLKITQSGQVQIRGILDVVMGPGLRSILLSQLREYDAMETETLTLGLQRGWDLKHLEPARRFLTDRTIRFLVAVHNSDSGIAEIMIRKNTNAMICSLKNLHRSQCAEPQLGILFQKIHDCETDHIRRLQSYL